MSCFSIACISDFMSPQATQGPSTYSTRNRWESLELLQQKRALTPSRSPLPATRSTRFYRRATGRQSTRLAPREADLKVELCGFMRKTEARRRNYALAAETECTNSGAHKSKA